MVRFAKVAGLVVVALLAISLSINALSYANFDRGYGFLKLKEQAIQTGWYLPFYYSHVLVAGVILLVGLFQLHPVSRTRFRSLHRACGYVYVLGILFFAAPGGLAMSLFIGRGPWVLTSFVLQSIFWFYFTAVAFMNVKKGDLNAHQDYMWRSYALTFAAVTLRIYIFFSSWSFDLSQPEAYATLAWMSWVPNLLVAELLIFKKAKRKFAIQQR